MILSTLMLLSVGVLCWMRWRDIAASKYSIYYRDKARKGNIPPKDKSYQGGFANIVECRLCHLKWLQADKKVDHCVECGSLKHDKKVATWIRRKKKGGFWLERS